MTDPSPAAPYLFLRPEGSLGAFVQEIWLGPSYPNRARDFVIEPDGRVDAVLAFDATRGNAVAFGSTTRATDYELDPALNYLGIRFRPGKSRPFLDLNPWELRDHHLHIDRIGGVAADVLLDVCASANAAQVGMTKVMQRLDTIAQRLDPRPSLIEALTEYVERQCGTVSVAELARQAALSERQLERLFQSHIGMSPKLFSRIVRYGAIRKALAAGSHLSADLAAQFGYTDQSHLSRDYQAFARATSS